MTTLKEAASGFVYRCSLCCLLDGEPAPGDTPPSAIMPCGWVGDGPGGRGVILGCIHVCSEEEVGHGLSQGRFQVVHSWHVCAAGSVTKDPLCPPPPCPVWATPLIVSDRRNWFQLTPIQRPFEWQTKDTATWRLMLVRSILEVVPSPPAVSLCPPPLPLASGSDVLA